MPSIEEIRSKLNKPLVRAMPMKPDVMADPETRTVQLAFASDQPVETWFGDLALSMGKNNVRTDRLDAGLAVLMDHDRTMQVGIVESFDFGKDGIARAMCKFSQSECGTEIFQDIVDGIRRSVSVGFMIHELHLEKQQDGENDLYRSDDWEPIEISLVSIPADISVGVGRSLDEPTIPKTEPPVKRQITEREDTMTPEEIAAAEAEQKRTLALAQAEARRKEVVAFAELYGEGDLARSMLLESDSITVDDMRTAIKDKRAQDKQVLPPPEDPKDTAHRQNPGSIQLARSMPRYGKLQNFTGEDGAERAYRFGQWIMAVRGIKSAEKFCLDHGIAVTRAMSEGVNESGGFLVPEEFGNDLIDLREQYGVFRRNAKMVPMSSDTRSDPRRDGGLTAYFEGEGDAITPSDMSWGRVTLVAKKLAVLARYSTELSEDSVIPMGDTLAGEIAYAFALKEDQCGFNGDGSSTYGGINGVCNKLLGLSGTIAYIAGLHVGAGNAYSEQLLTDFEATAGLLPVYADTPNAKWYMHKSVYWNVAVKLVLAAGGVTGAEIEGSRGARLLGYPVEFVQVMPSVEANSQICALFGDLALAASFGSRRDTTIAMSEHSRFANDQIEIRGTERFDINVHDVGNASATAGLRVPGPVVGLITAAS